VKHLVRKPEVKRPLGRYQSMKDGITMGHKEIGWRGVEWIHLAQDRVIWWAV